MISPRSLFKRYQRDIGFFIQSIQSWYSKKNFWIGLVLSSFAINLLALAFPIFLLQIYDRVISNFAVATLLVLLIGLLVAITLETIIRIIRSKIIAWGGLRFEYYYKTRIYNLITELSLQDVQRNNTGKFLEKFDEIEQLKQFYGGRFLMVLCDLPFVLLFLIFIGYLGGYIVLVPIIMIFIQIYFDLIAEKDISKIQQRKNQITERRNNFILNSLSGIGTIKAFCMEAFMLRRYERLQDSISTESLKMNFTQQATQNTNNLFSQIMMVLIATLGSLLVLKQALSLGALTACIILASRAMAIVNQVIEQSSHLERIKVVNRSLGKLIARENKAENFTDSLATPIQGKLEMLHVSYRERAGNRNQLTDINLLLEPGEFICIQGEHTAAENTLLYLLAGLIKPDAGRVLLDDKPYSMHDPGLINQSLICLTTEPVIFSGTLLENLTLFEAKYTETAKELCKKLGLDALIDRLPQGYATEISQYSGELLATGTRQLINIVRAFARDPQLILLNEVNSSLDYNSDRAFMKLLAQAAKTKSIIMINHRPSICRLASKHYTLEGTHLILADHHSGRPTS